MKASEWVKIENETTKDCNLFRRDIGHVRDGLTIILQSGQRTNVWFLRILGIKENIAENFRAPSAEKAKEIADSRTLEALEKEQKRIASCLKGLKGE